MKRARIHRYRNIEWKTAIPAMVVVLLTFLSQACLSTKYNLSNSGLRSTGHLFPFSIHEVMVGPDSLAAYQIFDYPERFFGKQTIKVAWKPESKPKNRVPFKRVPKNFIVEASDSQMPNATIRSALKPNGRYVIFGLTRMDRKPRNLYFETNEKGRITNVIKW